VVYTAATFFIRLLDRDRAMLEQFIEFFTTHWQLSSVWVVLFLLLIKTESARGGAAVSPSQMTQMINNDNAKVVDIRTKDEFRAGHLPNALHIPAKDMHKRMNELESFKDTPLILICKTGTTAGATGAVLAKAGFNKLHKLRGGILEWQGSNLPLVRD
jgi:rhodanese-related sulfurtransferase